MLEQVISENRFMRCAYQNSYSYFGVPGYTLSKMPQHSHGKPQPQIEYLPINIRSLSHKAMFESVYKFTNFPISSIKLNYMGVFSNC
jgi:iron complex outermembrane receptor protein